MDLKNILKKLITSNFKIILTSVTIKELEKMQHFNDIDGNDARYILALAAENPDSFKAELIGENLDTPDDCIIKYCTDNKEYIELLTSDKTMALKARMYNVDVKYLKQTKPFINSKQISPANPKVCTLFSVEKTEDKLLISILQTSLKSIRVYSNGIECNDGIIELRLGDDVYIATRKPEYITFAHYRIITLDSENNCELIFSKRIRNDTDIDILRASYKSFIKDFICRCNL